MKTGKFQFERRQKPKKSPKQIQAKEKSKKH